MGNVEGFAAVPNWIIRDQRFKRRAILVYMSLASRSGPGGIFPSQQTIADEMGLSERTVRSALADLEELGVIERVRRHSSSRGKASRLPDGYVLLPNGKQPATVAVTKRKQPATTTQATGKIAQSTLLIEEEPVEEEPDAREARSTSDLDAEAFDRFYAAFPRKVGKQAARKAFMLAVKRGADRDVIVAGAERFAADPNLPTDRQFIPHPSSWLNAGRWEDEPLPSRIAQRQTDDDALALIAGYREAEGMGAPHAAVGNGRVADRRAIG